MTTSTRCSTFHKKKTVEVHVYGKDLANMKRLRFDPAEKTVKFFASPKYDNC
jgi:hypothetical protein